MASDHVHYLSLMDVSAALRSGALTPTAVTEALLARIAHYDGVTEILHDAAGRPRPRQGARGRSGIAARASAEARCMACRSP